jgi:sec-independent protein translocase protein TatA
MAQGIRKVKDATQEIKSEIKKSAEKKGIDTDSISKEIDKVKDDIEDLTGSMKRKL